MTSCSGKIPKSGVQWYQVGGKYYCIYCKEYGCCQTDDFDSSSFQIFDSVNRTCDCQNIHYSENALRCPHCLMFELSLDKSLQDSHFCHRCLTKNPWDTYCQKCSIKTSLCAECGKKIQDGNFYLPSLQVETLHLSQYVGKLGENQVNPLTEWTRSLKSKTDRLIEICQNADAKSLQLKLLRFDQIPIIETSILSLPQSSNSYCIIL